MTVFKLLTHPFWSKYITRSKIYKVKIKEHVWAQKQNNHLQGSKIEKTEVTGAKAVGLLSSRSGNREWCLSTN